VRWLLALLLAAAPGIAEEADGAVAPAARWTGPRGPASGSYRSHALPVATEVEEAWRLELDRIAAPPVHWDGVGYLAGEREGKKVLLAFDLGTGRELAHATLKGFLERPGLQVWDDMVFLQTERGQILGYRRSGSSLRPVWIFRGRADGGVHSLPDDPVVHENEVYCRYGPSGGGLARLRPGSYFPVWEAHLGHHSGGGVLSAPAVRGQFVFAAWVDRDGFQTDDPSARGRFVTQVTLFVLRRSNGSVVATEPVCQAFVESLNPDPQITVTDTSVFIRSRWPLSSTAGDASYVRLGWGETRAGGILFPERPGLWNCRLPPADHPRLGAIVLADAKDGSAEWRLYRSEGLALMTAEKEQPDLFRDGVPPAILGDVCYFGSWAADLETREILWRLPDTRPSYAIVPADRAFLVVDNHRILKCFRGRGRK